MEVHKKAILSAPQKHTRVKSHVIRAPSDKDPNKGTFLGNCRENSTDSVKFITKVSIKKRSPKLQSNHEQVYDHENFHYVDDNSIRKGLVKIELNSLSTRKSFDQFSFKDDQQTEAFHSRNDSDPTGLFCDVAEKERPGGRLTSGDSEHDANNFACSQDKTDQTGFSRNHGQRKTRQTSFLSGSSHSPLRKGVKNSLCVVCLAEEGRQRSTVIQKTLGHSHVVDSKDKTGKTGFIEKRFDKTSNHMAGPTGLLTRRLCPSPPRDELTSCSVSGQTSLSSSTSLDRCYSVRHEQQHDVTPNKTDTCTKTKLQYVEEPDCMSNSSFSSKSDCPLCFIEELGIQVNRVTSRCNYRLEADSKTSQTGLSPKRSLRLPSVSLLDGFSHVEGDRIHNGHFPNRLQTQDMPVAVTRSDNVGSEKEVSHLVRSLTKKLATSKLLVKNCRPTLFAAPTIGELNLLKKGPGSERNFQRARAWSLPSVSRLDTVEAVLGQARCKTVDCSNYVEQEAVEAQRICCSRCSIPSSIPY